MVRCARGWGGGGGEGAVGRQREMGKGGWKGRDNDGIASRRAWEGGGGGVRVGGGSVG